MVVPKMQWHHKFNAKAHSRHYVQKEKSKWLNLLSIDAFLQEISNKRSNYLLQPK